MNPLSKVNVDPKDILSFDVLHLAGGVIGPNPLQVLVVTLKR